MNRSIDLQAVVLLVYGHMTSTRIVPAWEVLTFCRRIARGGKVLSIRASQRGKGWVSWSWRRDTQ